MSTSYATLGFLHVLHDALLVFLLVTFNLKLHVSFAGTQRKKKIPPALLARIKRARRLPLKQRSYPALLALAKIAKYFSSDVLFGHSSGWYAKC